MSPNKNQKNLSRLLGIVVFSVIAILGYFTISDLAGKQSQEHQRSISPVFALIEEELLKPLQLATTLSDLGVYDEYFVSEVPDQEALVKQLSEYHEKFGLEFYVAHDKSSKQYNSDGRVFDLVEGQVIWYFALKNEFDSKVQAVLGKREDVHLYIDVRQYDEDGEFIGFVGVGKSLSDFLSSFESFREDYGHEFLFVNNRDEIVLSSLPDLSPTQAQEKDGRIGIKQTSEISWLAEFEEKVKGNTEPTEIIERDQGDLLVSKMSLKSLNWNLYLMTPLNVRQQEVNKSFAIYIGAGFLLFLVAYNLLFSVAESYIYKVSRRINQDPLTKLANREYARQYFNRMRKTHREVSVILADLDNFGEINEKFGHMTGDDVIAKVADILRDEVDEIGEYGLTVRWDGEKFALIVMDTDSEQASDLAEVCRKRLSELEIIQDGEKVPVTASFGLCSSRQYADTLDVMIERSDRSVYRAKANGKDQVLLYAR